MPFSIVITPEQELARVWLNGAVTGRDLIAATDDLVVHPLYDSTFDQLWELTDVTSLDLSPEEMAALVEHDVRLVEAGVMGRIRVGIVVTREVRELAIRLYEYRMRRSGQDVRIFSTGAAAEAWLQEPAAHKPPHRDAG